MMHSGLHASKIFDFLFKIHVLVLCLYNITALFDLFRLRNSLKKYDLLLFFKSYIHCLLKLNLIFFFIKSFGHCWWCIIQKTTFAPIHVGRYACSFYIKCIKTMKTIVAAGLCGKFLVWYSDCRLQSCYWKSFVYKRKCGHAKIFI